MAGELEGKLRRSSQLETFNLKIEGFVSCGVFKEFSEEEMSKWLEAIGIYEVQRPQSSTTKLRADSGEWSGPELTEEPLEEVDKLKDLTAGWDDVLEEELAEVARVRKTSHSKERVEENFKACSKCVHKLLDTWLSVWSPFASTLPKYKLKDENRRASAQVHDVCNLHYDNKLTVTYRLCRMVEFLPSYDGLVREVKFSFRPRRHTGAGTFLPVELNKLLLSLLRLPASMRLGCWL